MEIKILSTEQVIYLMAALATLAASMLTLMLYVLRRTRDPYLRFYVVIAFAASLAYWLLMKFTFGQDQMSAARTLFLLVGLAALFTVVWRLIHLLFYVYCPDRFPAPFGFLHLHTNIWPYCLLIISWIMVTFWLTLYYTVPEPNVTNRIPILSNFVVLIVVLAFIRILWQLLDGWANLRLPGIKKARELRGILRAIDLDRHSFDILVDQSRIQITDVTDETDAVLGALLNHSVVAEVHLDERGCYRFRAIQQDKVIVG